MGAWGTGHFDNDTACDWAYQLEDSSNLNLIKQSIDAVFETDYIDSDCSCEALAAIETVSRLMGQDGIHNAYTEVVDQWVSANPLTVSEDIPEKAVKAIELIAGENSELAELWLETELADEWLALLMQLADKLKQAQP